MCEFVLKWRYSAWVRTVYARCLSPYIYRERKSDGQFIEQNTLPLVSNMNAMVTRFSGTFSIQTWFKRQAITLTGCLRRIRIYARNIYTIALSERSVLVRLISDSRLLDVAETFIGPNIALFASHYISKPPTDGRPVLWHQDGSYWPLAPMEVTTLWLAVDDSTPANGCMRVIPGTHRMELHEMQRSNDIPNVLSSHMDPAIG